MGWGAGDGSGERVRGGEGGGGVERETEVGKEGVVVSKDGVGTRVGDTRVRLQCLHEEHCGQRVLNRVFRRLERVMSHSFFWLFLVVELIMRRAAWYCSSASSAWRLSSACSSAGGEETED